VVADANFGDPRHLDLGCRASQTRFMAHSYIRFDFGTDEEKAQQARHKLDGWRQAFRLDKKLQYKVDRPESAPAAADSKPEPAAPSAPSKNPKPNQRKRLRARPHPLNQARRQPKNPRRPTEKSACSSACIFLRTKSFPSSAGWTVSPPKNRLRALHPKSFITMIRNSHRRTKQFETLE